MWCFHMLFSEWRGTMVSVIHERTDHLSAKLTTEKRKIILKIEDKFITEELKMIHKFYFVDSIDKTSGNVAFLCQKHYAQVLINKLVSVMLTLPTPCISESFIFILLCGVSKGFIKTFKAFIKPLGGTAKKYQNKRFVKWQHTKVKSLMYMKNFLLLYWTSKLYKNPTKAKFVIAAPKCSVKAPSKAVTAELKLNYNQMEHLLNIILVLKLSGQVRKVKLSST